MSLRKQLIGMILFTVCLAPAAHAGFWNLESTQAEIDALTGTQRTFGNEVELLPEATRADAVRREMMDEAEQFINIYTLYFDKDRSGTEHAKLLVEKLVESDEMEVNVIYHPLTQVFYGAPIMPLLRNAGAECRGYLAQDTIDPVKLALIGCHKKLLLTDSSYGTASTEGGRNIGGAYFDNLNEFADYDYLSGPPAGFNPEEGDFMNLWRDTDIYVRGDLNEVLMDDFITAFNYMSGKNEWQMDENDPRYYPELKVDEQSGNYQNVAVRMLHNEPEIGGLTQINDMYAYIIENAQDNIFIETPYFSPHDYQVELIKDALERGVKVTILTNAKANHDIKPVYYAGLQYFKELKAAGADIYLWALPAATGDQEGYTRTIHSKVVAVDNELFMPGSWNMSGRAHDWENEYAFAITDPELVAEGMEVLNDDIFGHGDYIQKVDKSWFKKNLGWKERLTMRFYVMTGLGYVM